MTDGPAETLTIAQVEALLDARIKASNEAHAKEMAVLQAQLDSAHRSMAGTTPALIPYHAGGPGTEIAETWSAWEQYLAHMADEAVRAEAA